MDWDEKKTDPVGDANVTVAHAGGTKSVHLLGGYGTVSGSAEVL